MSIIKKINITPIHIINMIKANINSYKSHGYSSYISSDFLHSDLKKQLTQNKFFKKKTEIESKNKSSHFEKSNTVYNSLTSSIKVISLYHCPHTSSI